MVDIVLEQGQSVPETMRTRYRDMGDGTHALVVADGTGNPTFDSLRVGDVDNGNYVEFDVNGFMFLYGDARGWIDFNFGVGALRLGATSPDLISLNATNIDVLAFNGINITETVSFDLELNHNWAEGTIIKPHVHWLPTTAGAGNVNWQLEYCFGVDGTVVGAASTTLNTIVAASGVAWQQTFSTFADIVTPGLNIGTQGFFRFFRDPTDNDTYAADAAIATIGLHVILNTIGSRQVGIK